MAADDRSARLFLGLTEAGLFPGVDLYLSLWYKRTELASRIALFFSAVTLSGAFGGILAFAIEKLDGKAGLHGWAWIVSIAITPRYKRNNEVIQFLIEGLVTVFVAIVAFWYMCDVRAFEASHVARDSCRI
jgi:MFS family permease